MLQDTKAEETRGVSGRKRALGRVSTCRFLDSDAICAGIGIINYRVGMSCTDNPERTSAHAGDLCEKDDGYINIPAD